MNYTVAYVTHYGAHTIDRLYTESDVTARLAALGKRGIVAEAWIEPNRFPVIGYSIPGRTLEDAPVQRADLTPLPYVYDDGGRAAAGFQGAAGDCVTRAVAIATCLPYQQVYDALSEGSRTQRLTKRSKVKASARNGVNVKRLWFKRYMEALGWRWTAAMTIGSGCKVHLAKGELPAGRLIARVSKHYVAVIDGVARDTHDCTRQGTRCVYGYWSRNEANTLADKA